MKKKQKLNKELLKGRERRKVENQKKLLPIYIESPEKLVGMKVEHKCVDAEKEFWFPAKVTGIKSLKTNPLKTEYNIIYDENPEETWFFPLLTDMKNGDLVVVNSQ